MFQILIMILDVINLTAILFYIVVILYHPIQCPEEDFYKEFIMKSQLVKVTYNAIRVEFQVRGDPNMHCLLLSENVKINVLF